MSPWLREVIQLTHSGRRSEAIAITRARAEAGVLAAKLRLAYVGDEAGVGRAQVDEILESAEQEGIAPEDSDAHWILYGAYEVRLGSCEYDEKARRSLRHLHAYASATNDPQATYATAVRYGQGDIGTKPNPELARELMALAAELGHPLAIAHMRRNRGGT